MISNIFLNNFRCFEELNIDFEPNITVFHGPNGIGKTNILESIYYLSTTKSFRARDEFLIRYQQEYFKISADYSDKKNVEIRYINSALERTKQAFLNQKKSPFSRVLGEHPVVLFVPEDLAIFTGASSPRRNLLDGILSQSDARYFKTLLDYKKLIRQRNALLRDYKQKKLTQADIRDQLFVWDLALVEPISTIIEARQKLIAGFIPIVIEAYKLIAAEEVKIDINYKATVDPENPTKSLKEAFLADSAAGFSTVGPHRDDIDVQFNGRAISKNASRGELRTFILAIKLAELFFIDSACGRRPILLLDDVFSELDNKRQSYLLDQLKDTQTIITTTEVNSKIRAKANCVSVMELAK